MISYDRPGYGGSTSLPGRVIASCAEDVRCICAQLRLDHVYVWGISGGGPHALASAALLPELVVAAAAVASPAPFAAEGLDWFAGMGDLNVDDTRLYLRDPATARAKMERDREELLAADAESVAQQLQSLLSPADAAVFTGALSEHLMLATRDGLAPGVQGWWEDSVADVAGWGFDVGDISIPTLVVHGRQDRFVPFAHGEWLAAHIPGAEALLTDTDGHLTLLANRVGEVHAWLLDHSA